MLLVISFSSPGVVYTIDLVVYEKSKILYKVLYNLRYKCDLLFVGFCSLQSKKLILILRVSMAIVLQKCLKIHKKSGQLQKIDAKVVKVDCD